VVETHRKETNENTVEDTEIQKLFVVFEELADEQQVLSREAFQKALGGLTVRREVYSFIFNPLLSIGLQSCQVQRPSYGPTTV